MKWICSDSPTDLNVAVNAVFAGTASQRTEQNFSRNLEAARIRLTPGKTL